MGNSVSDIVDFSQLIKNKVTIVLDRRGTGRFTRKNTGSETAHRLGIVAGQINIAKIQSPSSLRVWNENNGCQDQAIRLTIIFPVTRH